MSSDAPRQPEGDYLLARGTIVDGTGRAPYSADLRIAAGRVAEIAPDLAAGDCQVIDVEGLVVSPGFIDMHAHSEGPLWNEPSHLPKISQGVTFELLGQDGLGYAPVDSAATLAAIADRLTAWNGEIDYGDGWTTLAGYARALEGRGIGVNVAFLVPHGTLRLSAMGESAEAPTPAEARTMRSMLRDALSDGAVGLSTGLVYPPASYSTTEELMDLCAAMPAGGVFAPHLRDYGRGAFESYQEAIAIAEQSGVALHLTHALLNGSSNRGRAAELLETLGASDISMTFDVYPYAAGSTYLHVFLPGYLSRQPQQAQRMALEDPQEISALEESGELDHLEWDKIVVAGSSSAVVSRDVGRSVAAVARAGGIRPIEAYCRMITEGDFTTTCVHFNGNIENVSGIIQDGRTAIASDSILVGARPHPRGWGAFARFLEHYVGRGEMSLSEGVRRVTGHPASILGMARGTLHEGAPADISCFDPGGVRERSTFEQPRRLASGFHHVFVNGEPVLLHGEPTNVRSGRVLRGRLLPTGSGP